MNFASISNQTTVPIAKVAEQSSHKGIVSTTPIAYVLPSTTAICRHCGATFTRNPNVGPTCDEYFRCIKCRGISSKSFGCIPS